MTYFEVHLFAGVGLSTVFRIRRRFIEESLELGIFRKNAGNRLYRKLDGEAEGQLIVIACSEAPESRSRWTLRLLANRLVTLVVVDSIGPECVRTTLKKQTQASFERAIDDPAKAKR